MNVTELLSTFPGCTMLPTLSLWDQLPEAQRQLSPEQAMWLGNVKTQLMTRGFTSPILLRQVSVAFDKLENSVVSGLEFLHAARELRMHEVPVVYLTQHDLGDLDNRFAYHAPHGTQAARYGAVRDLCKNLAYQLSMLAPASPELQQALNALDLAMFQANAAIARREAKPAPKAAPEQLALRTVAEVAAPLFKEPKA
jgi:hypothetical protein